MKKVQCEYNPLIKELNLIFSLDQGKNWNSITMEQNGLFFEANFPLMPNGTEILYYYEGKSSEGEKLIENNQGSFYTVVYQNIDNKEKNLNTIEHNSSNQQNQESNQNDNPYPSYINSVSDKLELLPLLTVDLWQNREYLSLVKEFWKTNYSNFPRIEPILYIFWLQPEFPELKDHLVIYFDIKKDCLYPHLIQGVPPLQNIDNSYIFIGKPSEFQDRIKINKVHMVNNLDNTKNHNISEVVSVIIQLILHVAIRLSEGFKGSLNPEIFVLVNEKSHFYENKYNKKIPERTIDNKKFEITTKPIKMEITTQSELINLFKKMPKNEYVTPKYVPTPAMEPFNFKKNKPNIMGYETQKLSQRFAAEVITLKEIAPNRFPTDIKILNKFLNQMFTILKKEPNFPKEMSLNDVICLTKSLILVILPINDIKITYDDAIYNLMEANWLDPHLEPPHLTYPALMVRDILYLGGPINMIEFLKVPIGDVLGQNESIKFVTAENLKVG